MKESECHQLWMSAISCLLRLFHGIFILASKLWHRSLFTSQIERNKKLSVSASQNPLVLPVPPCQAHLGIYFFFSFLLTKNNWRLYPPARGFLTKCSTWILSSLLRSHQGTFCSTGSWFPSHFHTRFGGFHLDFRPTVSHQVCGW